MNVDVSSHVTGNGSGKKRIPGYVWRSGKKDKGKPLAECTEEELAAHYEFCESMLKSDDPAKPGRKKLLDNIHAQRRACNAEMLVRFLGSKYKISKYNLYETFSVFTKKYQDDHPDISSCPIGKIMGGCPPDFTGVTIHEAMLACIDSLGSIDMRGVTKTFICSLGINMSKEDWMAIEATPEEIMSIMLSDKWKQCVKQNGNGRGVVGRNTIIKYRNNIKPEYEINFNPSGLTLQQFVSVYHIHGRCRYSDLSDIQLSALRDKVLPSFEMKIGKQIEQWKERQRQIKEVARYLGYQTIT